MKAEDFFNLLKEHNVNCYCGVPDSLLKDFCAYITDNTTAKEHTITANEGNAIALGAGHYLATGNPAVVYMQNSGLGNCVNPLLSLTDEEVYNIPLLLLIGWRGEPGVKDEPQHIKQGKVTEKLLETMGIKFEILPDDINKAKLLIDEAFTYMKQTQKVYAFIVKKGTFEKYSLVHKTQNNYELLREEAIEKIISSLNYKDIVVSTTGYISREVYETREKLGQGHKQDFLTVGSMGHTSSIAIGIAIEKPDRNVFCFDGDGAFLMHQGAIIVNASKKLKNFKHIVFNNEAHDSVGAQPTALGGICLDSIALNSGYTKTYKVSTKEELDNILPVFLKNNCNSFLEIKVKCGARSNLGRPKEKPCENKLLFMQNLNQIDFCYRGAIENLSEIIKNEKPNNILIFTGKKSYKKIQNIIETQLNGIKFDYYNNFSTNPKIEEINYAVSILSNYDMVIAVGGGSVIDFAKIYKDKTKCSKLIAIPTTCGTGSEATQFAVYYENNKKHSLDKTSILPDYAIIDSSFVENNPKYLKACTALDALCQAIESYWAIKATKMSKILAQKAMELLKDNIINYVNSDSTIAAENMALASNLAGKAINISRTTASHALSYKITTDYNIPHGHAVALSISKLMSFNEKTNQNTINEIKQFLGIIDISQYFKDLFTKLGVEVNINKLGINNIDNIVDSVNIDRLKNNPTKLTKPDLIKLFETERE